MEKWNMRQKCIAQWIITEWLSNHHPGQELEHCHHPKVPLYSFPVLFPISLLQKGDQYSDFIVSLPWFSSEFFLSILLGYNWHKFGFGVWNEAGKRLVEFCQENANTLFQQHKRRLCIWTSPDGQHQNQIDYILCSQRWRSSIQSA